MIDGLSMEIDGSFMGGFKVKSWLMINLTSYKLYVINYKQIYIYIYIKFKFIIYKKTK